MDGEEGMSRTLRWFAALLAVTLAMPAAADAQRLVRLGAGGGVTLPISDLADVTEQGFHAQVMLGMNIPLFPIALRIDGAYHQLPAAGDGHLRQIAVTANARVAGIGLPITPYLIAGVGVYNSRFSDNATADGLPLGTDSSTDFGINAGAGLLVRFVVVQFFAEGRYHHVFNGDGMQHVPITIGIMF
jgi:hypothetical protein